MDQNTQIFLKAKRGLYLGDQYAQAFHQVPISSKTVLNREPTIEWSEISLKPLFRLVFTAKVDCAIILLPLVGSLDINGNSLLGVGESQIEHLKKGKEINISNPYSNEVNHFLRVIIPYEASFPKSRTSFSLDESKNQITTLFSINNQNDDLPPISFKLGCFDGRAESCLVLTNDLFVYPLNGAFEVQNCLLEQADGLKICDSKEVELEALSQEAMMAFLEF